jgi:hypothetical protein
LQTRYLGTALSVSRWNLRRSQSSAGYCLRIAHR